MLKSNISRVNFTCAIVFIVILFASITLTGSFLGKTSLTQAFGQLQHQETPLKLWTVDSSTNNSKTANVTKANVTRAISSNATNATNTKAISTNFNTFANVNVQKLITNIAGPVHINFVNSYWTSNTAQDQFVAATQSGLEHLLNSNLGLNQFLTGSESGPSSNIALQPVIKQEVAPGEGPSLLAVTLVNEGFSAITGITASLELPQGFQPLITPCCSSIPGANPQTALSSYDGVAEPGDAFTIYFNVKVLGNAQVGKQYNSDLKLGYVKVTELRAKLFRSETIAVPFTISGRVILDLASYSPPLSSLSNFSSLVNSSSLQTITLIPGVPNAVKLSLRNDGSATARGVIANIGGVTAATVVAPGVSTQITVSSNVSAGVAAQPTSSSTVILGPKVFNVGIVSPGGSKNISLVIYPSVAAAGTTQTLTLTLLFNDAYGNRQSTNQLVGLQILPISPQTGLTVTPSSPSTSLSPPTSSPSTSPPPTSSTPSYSASPATSSGNEMLTKIATFVHSSTNPNNGNRTPYPSSPNPSSTSYSPIQIVAGKIQNVTFTINNSHAAASRLVNPIQNSISDLAVSLVPKSSFARILGPSTWNIPALPSGSGQKLTTQVFASTSLIGNPVVFNVTIQYTQNGHQVKTASFDLGAIVVGDIQLKVNNLGIRYFGNSPALVGSILNEGNTPAQFANVEMLEQGQDQLPSNNNLATILVPTSSQYLGDIATNSPKSFSIPLQAAHVPISKSRQQNNISTDKAEAIPSLTTIALNSSSKSFGTGAENNTDPAIYRVLLKITYIDDLKNSHDLIVDSPLQIKPTQMEGSSNQGNDLLAILACGVAIGIATVFIIKWLRSKGNENPISTTNDILSRITMGRVTPVISIASPPDEKKAGAPFSPL
jgi:hypothetical protein